MSKPNKVKGQPNGQELSRVEVDEACQASFSITVALQARQAERAPGNKGVVKGVVKGGQDCLQVCGVPEAMAVAVPKCCKQLF